MQELIATFNKAFKEYDRWRPNYSPEVYEEIFKYKELSASTKAIEVGIGTGQATLPILQTGCEVTAIEIGDQLAAFCEEKFKDYENFEVKNMGFQDFEGILNSYDLIYSASAFHWIPEEIGYAKVFDLLKSGGVFARIDNHPYKDKGRPELDAAIQKIYSKYMYMPDSVAREECSDKVAERKASIPDKYGFEYIGYKLFPRTRNFTAEEYTALLGTYSDHLIIEEIPRAKFFAEIREAIYEHGGVITVYDTIELHLARKP